MSEGNACVFVVSLKFGPNRVRASELMEGHVRWIQRGIDAGVFLLAGSLPDRQGGAILAYGIGQDALEVLLKEDPFVEQGVVTLEIVDIAVSKIQERASFLVRSSLHASH